MEHPIGTEEMETAIGGKNAVISIENLSDILHAVQEDVEELWDDYMSAVEEGDLIIVAEEDDYLVLADLEGIFWQNQIDSVIQYANLLGVQVEGVPETVLAAHHNAAQRNTDYSWATANPVVISKPNGFDNGQSFVEAGINSLIAEGLSPGQAWAYYGVILRGNSRNAWANRTGYTDHSTVSEAVRKAKEKLGD